jgi:iron-sulfur cluster insertion protein
MLLQDLKNIPFSITISSSAIDQIQLMKEHDFTLQDHFIRIVIKGKGCNGFTYSIQFSSTQPEDIKVPINDNIEILLDPFTAQFVRAGSLDFIQTHLEEGFQFINEYENLFHGKFFKDLKL